MIIGGIFLWYGDPSALPAGYQVCDGTNGTPDMRSRFAFGAEGMEAGKPIGLDEGSAEAFGGACTHTHGYDAESVLADGEAYQTQLTYANHMPPYRALWYVQRLT